MSEEFAEDEIVLNQLTDPVDIEAFKNLMEHAHSLGQSAASFVREESERTSRSEVRKLCRKDKKKVFRDSVRSYFRRLWTRGSAEGEGGGYPVGGR